jgi:dTDP-4-amino-4,6-dideoxygalactose transaminase
LTQRTTLAKKNLDFTACKIFSKTGHMAVYQVISIMTNFAPVPFIDLATQQKRIRPAVEARFQDILNHGKYIFGPEVFAAEKELAAFSGAKDVISCASGTDALWLPLLAEDIGAGDAIFVPSFTFTATVEAVRFVGAEPVFVDVDPDTYVMCPDSLKSAIAAVHADGRFTPKVVIPVDLFGMVAPYAEISAIAADHGMWVMADAAQSFGGSLGGRKVGAFGRVTATSFFPAKPLGVYGDGGAIFTDDAALADRIRSVRNHGQGHDKYENVRVGTNSRLDSMQAAVLLEKLTIFPDELEKRQAVADRYEAGLKDVVKTPVRPAQSTSAWAQYTIQANNRADAMAALQEQGIPTAIYYPNPLHMQAPYLAHLQPKSGMPITENIAKRVFSLPFHPYLAPDVQDRIIAAVRACVK